MPGKNGYSDPDEWFLESAEDIFARDHPVEEIVEIPEWQKQSEPEPPKVRLRGMDGESRRVFEDKGVNIDRFGQDDYLRPQWWTKQRRYDLIARSVVRKDGVPVFTMDQVQKLAKLQAKPVERLFQAAQRVNGYDAEDLKSRKNAGVTEEAGTLATASRRSSEGPTSVASSETS